METEDANLNVINTLKEKLVNCDVGYSGHESGLAVSFAASTMKISSLERHAIQIDQCMDRTKLPRLNHRVSTLISTIK